MPPVHLSPTTARTWQRPILITCLSCVLGIFLWRSYTLDASSLGSLAPLAPGSDTTTVSPVPPALNMASTYPTAMSNTSATSIAPQLRVVPLPTSFSVGQTLRRVSPSLRIDLHGSGPRDLLIAIQRTQQNILATRFEYLSPLRGAELFDQSDIDSREVLSHVILELEGSGSLDDNGKGGEAASIKQCVQRAAEERLQLESYKLSIPTEGAGRIRAKTALGLLRGLTTLEQLLYYLPDGGKSVCSSAALGRADQQERWYSIRPLCAVRDQRHARIRMEGAHAGYIEELVWSHCYLHGTPQHSAISAIAIPVTPIHTMLCDSGSPDSFWTQ